MAEPTTIARPYAEAAFGLAREANTLPHWSSMLRYASSVVTDPAMAKTLDNPVFTAGDKKSLLLSVCGDKLDAAGRRFIEVLVDADRFAVLPQIAALFDHLKNEAEGVAIAQIDSAFPKWRLLCEAVDAKSFLAVAQNVQSPFIEPFLNGMSACCPTVATTVARMWLKEILRT